MYRAPTAAVSAVKHSPVPSYPRDVLPKSQQSKCLPFPWLYQARLHCVARRTNSGITFRGEKHNRRSFLVLCAFGLPRAGMLRQWQRRNRAWQSWILLWQSTRHCLLLWLVPCCKKSWRSPVNVVRFQGFPLEYFNLPPII